MAKDGVNYSDLSNSLSYVEKRFFKLADVKHKLERVGFDIFKFKDGSSDELWQIQNADDGEYIVAKYETDLPKASIASKWEVLTSYGDINIFYKGQQITKFAGVASDELDLVKRFLPEKLASDKNFVKALLNTLDEESKVSLLKSYPELA
jgi:hypothetical protein